MPKVLLAAGLSLFLALGVFAFYISDPAPPAGSVADAPSAERLIALESALEEERQARQLLEEELFRLIDEVEQLKGRNEPVATEVSDDADTAPVAEARSRFIRRSNLGTESRADQLVAGGFSPDRAAAIARREAELRMEAMRAKFDFEAGQGDVPLSFVMALSDVDGTLRKELGDVEYEQYLEASNRSTSVRINDVLELSPAEQAGLQSGDRILSYNGERVFNLRDLNRQQMAADVGANVVVGIVRDGVPMQVTVPRGPLGVMAGRGR